MLCLYQQRSSRRVFLSSNWPWLLLLWLLLWVQRFLPYFVACAALSVRWILCTLSQGEKKKVKYIPSLTQKHTTITHRITKKTNYTSVFSSYWVLGDGFQVKNLIKVTSSPYFHFNFMTLKFQLTFRAVQASYISIIYLLSYPSRWLLPILYSPKISHACF